MPSNNVHFSSQSSDWETPSDFFNRLRGEFRFTLDVCATDENAKCTAYYTEEHNALTKRWYRAVAPHCWAWMNPPYGREIKHWVQKAALQNALGLSIVCLLPARTDTKWFHDHVFGTCQELRLVKGRLKFGSHRNSAPFPSMVAIYHGYGTWHASNVSGPHETRVTTMLANLPRREYPVYYAMPRRLRIRHRGNRHDHQESGE